jgi:hypothetical protein
VYDAVLLLVVNFSNLLDFLIINVVYVRTTTQSVYLMIYIVFQILFLGNGSYTSHLLSFR